MFWRRNNIIMSTIKRIKTIYNCIAKPVTSAVLPIKIQIETVNNCNLRCLSCSRSDVVSNPKIMPYENFVRIIDEIKPIYITLSGLGENLLNPELCRMIRYCAEKNIFVSSITNGVILDRYYDKLSDAGLELLSVSLDATDRQTYYNIRRFDVYDAVLRNVRLLTGYKKTHHLSKPRVRASFCIQRHNIEEISGFLNLCRQLEVDEAHFQPLLVANVNERKDDLTLNLTKDLLREKLVSAKELGKTLGLANNINEILDYLDIYWRQYDYEPGRVINESVCLNPWYDAFIDVSGNIKPCCNFSWRPQSGIMGNVLADGASACFNNKQYKHFRAAIKRGEKPFAECAACNPVDIRRIVRWARSAIYNLF